VLAPTLAVEIRAVYRKLRLHVRQHWGGNDLTHSQISVLHRLEKAGAANGFKPRASGRHAPAVYESCGDAIAGVRPLQLVHPTRATGGKF
jgi:hypothetical protein